MCDTWPCASYVNINIDVIWSYPLQQLDLDSESEEDRPRNLVLPSLFSNPDL